MTTYIEASDAMKACVYAAWKAATVATVGTEQKLFFQDRIKAGTLEVGTPDEYWARVVVQHVAGETAAIGGRKRTAYGLLWVQMFFPLAKVGAWRKGQQIAEPVKNALADTTTSGTVWFFRARINDNIPADATHHRLNVVADFQYDEIV